MHILQVNTHDIVGGAGYFAYNLHQKLLAKGYPAWLIVGFKWSADPTVVSVPYNAKNFWRSFWFFVGDFLIPLVGKVRGTDRVIQLLRLIGEPKKLLESLQGHENFEFPETWRIFDLIPNKPDIVHLHNLHGNYFDLRALPWLSQQTLTVLTMHDAWLLSGHCAHSFDCERWKTGCGKCPNLTIYQEIKHDGSAYNWRRKKDIYNRSRLYLATPSRWLMEKVEQSILCPAILESRVIPNGVDLKVFRPSDMQSARSALGIPQNIIVLLLGYNALRKNTFKDSLTMTEAIAELSIRFVGQKVLFIAMGENAPSEHIGNIEIQFAPHQKDPMVVAAYYQAADIYIHNAKADTFPTAILEALSCGTPVVATSIGGIPEQVRSLRNLAIENERKLGNKVPYGFSDYSVEEATGILVPAGDVSALAGAIEGLVKNEALRKQLGVNAAIDACYRFDFERCANDYITWYREIIEFNTKVIPPTRVGKVLP